MRKPPVLPGDSLSRSADGRLSGSALIIVLAFLVILTGMIVAFFSSVTNEQIGTKVESNSMAAHNLADSVAGIVIAQLRDATVGYARNANGSLNTNIPLGWASQPTNAFVSWDSANANIKSWWYGSPGVTRKSLTGDNVRERPYDYLYPRLTTKSNTYTVHYRVQVLQQVAPIRSTTASWQSWNDASDKVVADQRGSAMIERYIDPNDPTIPDFAGLKDTSGTTLSPGDPALIMDNYYRYRTLNAKIFTP